MKDNKDYFYNVSLQKKFPSYNVMSPFSENIAVVENNGRYGYINADGALITKTIYDRAGIVTNGKGTVFIGNKWAFINTSGEVMDPGFFSIPSSWSEIYNFYYDVAIYKENNMYGYVKSNGDIITKAIFRYATPFNSHNMAIVNDGVKDSYNSDIWNTSILGGDLNGLSIYPIIDSKIASVSMYGNANGFTQPFFGGNWHVLTKKGDIIGSWTSVQKYTNDFIAVGSYGRVDEYSIVDFNGQQISGLTNSSSAYISKIGDTEYVVTTNEANEVNSSISVINSKSNRIFTCNGSNISVNVKNIDSQLPFDTIESYTDNSAVGKINGKDYTLTFK